MAGQWSLFRKAGRPGRLLVLNAAALILAYPLLKVNFASWYIVPVVTALLYGLPFAAGEAGRAVASFSGRTIGVLLVLGMLSPAILSIAPKGLAWYRRSGQGLRYEGYRAAGLWIRQHSRPEDAIAAMEVGTLAYFSQRRVEDLQGLVTPRSIPFTLQGDPAGAFLAGPTRFVIVRPSLKRGMNRITRRRWFRRSYEEVARFHPGTADWTQVYGLKPGADLPAGGPRR